MAHTSDFITALNQKLEAHFLLNNPFYQAWVAGELTVGCLQFYAQQYFHNVRNFPRYISATHANCDDLSWRQVLLDNLAEEEKGDRNHPELWLRFAEGLGMTREDVLSAQALPQTQKLVDTFFELARSSYAEGLGALYAYERQIPAIAESKIDGLKKHYGIDSDRALDFFQVHLHADVEHAQATQDLLNALSEADRVKAEAAACRLAAVLWDMLTAIYDNTSDLRVAA